MAPDDDRPARVRAIALVVIALVAVGWALHATRVFSAPFTFAFFLSLLVHPLQRRLLARAPQRWRWLGLAAAVAVLVLAMVSLVIGLALVVGQAVREAPKHADALRSTAESALRWAEGHGLPVGEIPKLIDQSAGRALEAATAAIGGVWEIVGFLVLVLFFAILMLFEAKRWSHKVLDVFRGEEATRVLDAIRASAGSVRRYLLALTVVGLATAVLEGGFLAVVGVELVWLWATLFFLLNYIPILGSVLAAIPPILFTFATQGPVRALWVALGILVIEQVMGNVVAPVVEGKQVKVSPLVVLGAVTFWGWIWGPVGALLAVPITATLLMVSARHPSLRPIAVLLAEHGQSDASAAGRAPQGKR